MNLASFKHRQRGENREEELEEGIDFSSFHTIIRGGSSADQEPPKLKLESLVQREIAALDLSTFDVLIREEKYPVPDASFTTIQRASGWAGKDGERGDKGEKGDAGDKGDVGDVGSIGLTGATGEKGEKGDRGADGKTGARGSKGDKGDQGIQGLPGEPGRAGRDGLTGTTGKKGTKGDKGDAGEKGEKGEKGDTGDKGDTGARGLTGNTGETGAKGDKGDKGDRGERGIAGAKGDKGDAGEVGPSGKNGDVGSKGDKGDKGTAGEKGEKGEKGDTGDRGEKGDQGIQGIPGPPGYNGKPGTIGEPGHVGPMPQHKYSSGVLAFETEKGKYGPNINLKQLVEKAAKGAIEKMPRVDATMNGGGAVPMDWIVGDQLFKDARYLNIDTTTLLATFANGVITIGVNPAYMPDANASATHWTYDYFKLLTDDEYVFFLNYSPVWGSETVIMNGLVLTQDLDYDIDGNMVTIKTAHATKKDWNLTVKYSHIPTDGIAIEQIIIPEAPTDHDIDVG